ncbi:uncharacterized protein LOC127874786 [Dreissena polymorpha]|uniref:uncharacterized protein LOC127874786 n=1 Tax=Dreissena polymorpha TaxID=45954 RepID=UPI002264CCDB|nr:uncharacterized protein LOC127874786 [Dreissena polymorpha]
MQKCSPPAAVTTEPCSSGISNGNVLYEILLESDVSTGVTPEKNRDCRRQDCGTSYELETSYFRYLPEPAQEASSTSTELVQLGAISVPPGTDSHVPETPEPLLETTSSSTGGTFVPPSMGSTSEQVDLHHSPLERHMCRLPLKRLLWARFIGSGCLEAHSFVQWDRLQSRLFLNHSLLELHMCRLPLKRLLWERF